jgi:hypothetical protein
VSRSSHSALASLAQRPRRSGLGWTEARQSIRSVRRSHFLQDLSSAKTKPACTKVLRNAQGFATGVQPMRLVKEAVFILVIGLAGSSMAYVGISWPFTDLAQGELRCKKKAVLW